MNGRQAYLETGSCCTVVLLRKEDGKNILYSANVGDSTAIISKNSIGEAISLDHKTSNDEECDRAEKDGGSFMMTGGGPFRLNGVLTVTRAFGDHQLKPKQGLIVDPTVNRIEVDDSIN